MPLIRSCPSTPLITRISSPSFQTTSIHTTTLRHQSHTSRRSISTTAYNLNRTGNKIRNGIIGGTIVGTIGFSYLYFTDTRSVVHRYQVVPFLRWIYSGDDIPAEAGGKGAGAEKAHEVGLKALRALYDLGFGLRERGAHEYLESEELGVELFGHNLKTPLAISAGLDKHAECIDPLFNISPAISLIEIGCITPLPQEGNPKPRMFRLPTSNSIINRYGFNSVGADTAAVRLRERVRRYALKHGLTEREVLDSTEIPASLWENRLLAVQIGKNKSTPETNMEAVKKDYITCVEKLGRYADILVVNVSSPNTPGLRSLQKRESLQELLAAVVLAAGKTDRKVKPKVVVKVSPDSDGTEDVKDISAAVKFAGVAGVIVANTTVKRPLNVLASPQVSEEEKRVFHKEIGGLSGPVLLPKTLELVERYSKELGNDTVVFASGGIISGKDVLEARKRGAKIVMGYTGMVYDGVGFFGRIAEEMKRILDGGK
ncbi:FMN-linked oxidoreductase [Choiromyces venosus 120613-1]|uniref:FMN-linked oxidoreductase n=1 Tax=Choiromyces venosus 120613-1 TaxID=1336337 RepID=A0A3N4J3W7_9PEZI|nr:FMN-linked oxidoreductase [Choiromyces venosus 120613-1]